MIIVEIPYQVNKADMVRKTADLVNDKKIEGISKSETRGQKRHADCVRAEARRHPQRCSEQAVQVHTATNLILSQHSACQGRPELLNLKQMMAHYIDHRHDVVVRRTQFDLNKRKRAHILQGLIIALDNIDEVIALICEQDA